MQGPCITEDTALCFEGLNGLPGPYIKHFMKKLGLDGEIGSTLHVISFLLSSGLNTLLEGFPTKNATAVCTFAYSTGPGTEPILFEGRVEGRIVPPRGAEVFGWNPIFEEATTGKTYVGTPLLSKMFVSLGSEALLK